jgi:hypothetical protein
VHLFFCPVGLYTKEPVKTTSTFAVHLIISHSFFKPVKISSFFVINRHPIAKEQGQGQRNDPAFSVLVSQKGDHSLGKIETTDRLFIFKQPD